MTTPPFDPQPSTADEDEPEPEAAWIGRTLGERYVLEDILGAGGIAVVFRATDSQLGRAVAVKVLREETAGHDVLRARFEREARVLASLSHPHIVSLIDFGVTDARPFLVMELLAGQTLGDLLHDHGGSLPPERAFSIVRQVVAALAYAHGEGLLHRDLKPDNVFLQAMPGIEGDHVKLLDFGFAKLVDGREEGAAQLTLAGTAFGTPRYMAPEQLTGSTVDGRVDLYAAAVILYEALSGRRPFEGEIREVLRAKVAHDPPALSEVAPELSAHPDLEAFLGRALATVADERYADARAFLDALAAIPQPAVETQREADAASRPSVESSSSLPPEAAGSPSRDAADATAVSEPAAAVPGNAAAVTASRRPFPLVAIAMAAGVAAITAVALVVAAFGGSEAEPEAAKVASLSPAAPEEPPQDGPSLLEVPDPWANALDLAPAVVEARELVLEGVPLDLATLRDLRDHAREHPDDAYAQLLLGHVYAQRNMRAMAVTAYQRAVEADPGARGDPRMIVDLVRMVADGGRGDGPARLVRRHYGAEAIGVVDAALDSRGVDRAGHRRLSQLRESLE